jgi:hypothetical protein
MQKQKAEFLGAFAKFGKKKLLALSSPSVSPSVCPSVRIEQFGSHRTDFDET